MDEQNTTEPEDLVALSQEIDKGFELQVNRIQVMIHRVHDWGRAVGREQLAAELRTGNPN